MEIILILVAIVWLYLSDVVIWAMLQGSHPQSVALCPHLREHEESMSEVLLGKTTTTKKIIRTTFIHY